MNLYFNRRLLESAQISIKANTTPFLMFHRNGSFLLNTRNTHCVFIKYSCDIRQFLLNPKIYKSYLSLCSCSQLAHSLVGEVKTKLQFCVKNIWYLLHGEMQDDQLVVGKYWNIYIYFKIILNFFFYLIYIT